ncbi:hypothetical protein A3D42_01260 [Candidatus Nomurabacteria bacterium RIFCSPHIGHO2_02_FULL_41_18]|uniref:Thioredoxin domain-containing protein n=1 Tax=Candidatus Nomurabacteria bacterium RIFCSPHIGHO2_02_FULL_41_18 TaxID=1801754 RepID=A0A1F6W7L1_9BACT|nr:MAG: hypothetical protein A2737_00010 [Candidatus Nomurabacteria bacterium RIFCSPHIGHO2_01_FULL_41_71]OGI77824.1 MAG: hypothetical protein A3D42_01260 [Candidatus Nomurabacteria bacterium RIFCSPHIGHO2_02_FULL_41_18]OGI89974.1 MAG: hypothetical protein A3B01_01910 [Candidatus Nomurabacteria bacterium RIFCSPLOWO2_01_FULL_41_52b]OGJ00486.1 MAG: hypothetical protein A3I90_00500 [Candidatus Nomurabacteria bacterium RIFCSPLOWO2_02_FULL_41_9]
MNSGLLDWKKYIIVFFITVFLFMTAVYLSNYFGSRKIAELKSIQDQIAINILSSETEFSLLSELSCKNTSGLALSDELDELGRKLEWGESNLGNDDEVAYLKKYYSLLEIKDYLLQKKISARCGTKAAFILYFYTNREYCGECERQALTLSLLRDKYRELRVYSFDFSIGLSAVDAMINIYKIKDTKLPAMVVDDDVMTGFHGIEELEAKVTKSFEL